MKDLSDFISFYHFQDLLSIRILNLIIKYTEISFISLSVSGRLIRLNGNCAAGSGRRRFKTVSGNGAGHLKTEYRKVCAGNFAAQTFRLLLF